MENEARDHYDDIAGRYDDIYDDEDTYPAQQICRDIAVDIVRGSDTEIGRVLDIGCGTGRSMLPLLEDGVDVRGFDFSREMVTEARENLAEHGFDPDLVVQGDLNEGIPIDGKFDAVISLGALPHVDDKQRALERIDAVTREGGVVLVQLRNMLFNLFTLNEYSYGFVFQELLSDVDLPTEARRALEERLQEAFETESPTVDDLDAMDNSGAFSNPLTVEETFGDVGFEVEELYFHHYHAMLPEFASEFGDSFRRESLRLEEPDDWRGYLLASAFLVEAVKPNPSS